MALAVTSDVFSEDDCAGRIIPAISPCLMDKEKLVRDQANKAIDVYLQRVRKFASTMPDSVLPPPSTAENSASATPRMATPQPSEAASWTGWAISSFTNKVSTAAGEIESTTTPTSSRPSTAPPVPLATRPPPPTASASALHRQAVATPPAASTRTSTSSSANNYFDESNDGVDVDVDVDDAWGDMEDESFFDASSELQAPAASKAVKPTSKSSAANPFDDGGEPDFAGWLAAQSAKKPGAKALPKGLSKPAASNKSTRPASARSATTSSLGTGIGAKKAAVAAKPAAKKVIDTKPKVTEDDDSWGDGW